MTLIDVQYGDAKENKRGKVGGRGIREIHVSALKRNPDVSPWIIGDRSEHCNWGIGSGWGQKTKRRTIKREKEDEYSTSRRRALLFSGSSELRRRRRLLVSGK